MQRTKIEWTDFVWNPVKGTCPVNCFYCYARRMYKRFKWNPELSWDGRIPILSSKKPSRIFVCSTMEIFHPQIPKEWRDRIFKTINQPFNKKHTFQILTKMPENIDRPMPDNVWLGTTVTKNEEEWKIETLCNIIEHFENWNPTIFVSVEPMFDSCEDIVHYFDDIEWLIIGSLTGKNSKKYQPKRYWIEALKDNAFLSGVPIFLKDNLKEIWGEDLIQEFPE